MFHNRQNIFRSSYSQSANAERRRYDLAMSLASGSAIARRIVLRLLGCIEMDEVHFARHLRLPGGTSLRIPSTGDFAGRRLLPMSPERRIRRPSTTTPAGDHTCGLGDYPKSVGTGSCRMEALSC